MPLHPHIIFFPNFFNPPISVFMNIFFPARFSFLVSLPALREGVTPALPPGLPHRGCQDLRVTAFYAPRRTFLPTVVTGAKRWHRPRCPFATVATDTPPLPEFKEVSAQRTGGEGGVAEFV